MKNMKMDNDKLLKKYQNKKLSLPFLSVNKLLESNNWWFIDVELLRNKTPSQ